MTDRPSTATEPAPRAPALLRRVLPGVADLRNYHLGWLRPDLLAGLAVWAVLVPQGLAYGEHAGLSPVTGLYTALGALVLYALVGSSRYLHVGPESSVAIVTAAYVVLRRALLRRRRCSVASRDTRPGGARTTTTATCAGCPAHPPQHQRSRGRRDGAPGEVGPET